MKRNKSLLTVPEILRQHHVKSAQCHRTQMVILGHRLSELGFVSYRDYLKSPHWYSFRARWYRKMGNPPCSRCHRSHALELHHRLYNRLGAERFSDVVGLCRSCHAATHDFSKSKKSHYLTTAHRDSRNFPVPKLTHRRRRNPAATRGPWQNPRTATSVLAEAEPRSPRIDTQPMSPEGRLDEVKAPLSQHVPEHCPKPLSPASAPAG